MNSVVSIITPTYNRAHLLPRVWASLNQQTEQRFQWIVVDDGSTDNSREIVLGFNDPRITYVWQANQGVNHARNRGEKEIQADYVIYLDSDDELIKNDTLQEMITAIQATRPEIAWVAFTVVDSEGRAGLYHLPDDWLETYYLDHVCEQKIWGEFFPIYRRDALEISAWPLFNGLEVLRHWRILQRRPALMINRPARIYHRQQGDHLTGAYSAVRRAGQMAEAIKQLIQEHRAVWLSNCPCQLGKYSFYRAMYLALSTTGYFALPDLLRAFRFGRRKIKIKALVLGVNLLLPIEIRQWLFIKRSLI